MRIGIVGARSCRRRTFVIAEIQRLFDEHQGASIVTGDANGVDNIAREFAKDNNLLCRVYLAAWRKYGRAAGPKRNSFIIDDSDVLIAFPDKSSIGTWDSIRKAKAKGIPVVIIKI